METVIRLGRALPALQELVLANNNNSGNGGGAVLSTAATMRHSTDATSAGAPDSSSSNNEGATSTHSTRLQLLASQLAEVLPNLVFLDCSNCTRLVSSSSDHDKNALVIVWSKLGKLQSLSLDDNPDLTVFGLMSDKDGDESSVFYPALQHLQFAGTGLADWTSVAAWNDLAHLTSLQLSSPARAQRERRNRTRTTGSG